jgi:hypothetical protein
VISPSDAYTCSQVERRLCSLSSYNITRPTRRYHILTDPLNVHDVLVCLGQWSAIPAATARFGFQDGYRVILRSEVHRQAHAPRFPLRGPRIMKASSPGRVAEQSRTVGIESISSRVQTAGATQSPVATSTQRHVSVICFGADNLNRTVYCSAGMSCSTWLVATVPRCRCLTLTSTMCARHLERRHRVASTSSRADKPRVLSL